MPSEPEIVRYGPHPAQYGELYRPARASPPGSALRPGWALRPGVVVVLHGGFWRARYGLELGRRLAADLADAGYTCWNVEYRRVGAGGGWPATFEDVAAAVDALHELPVDASAVVAIGHSAGGHLAAWLAGRDALPPAAPGGDPAVRLAGVVAQAGMLDLATAARTGVGATAVRDLLGGGPDEVPDRYALADPIAHVPRRAPVMCVHARADEDVPFAQSAAYVAAVAAAGGAARLYEVPGGHFTVIDPADAAWTIVRDALPDLLVGRLPDV